MRLRRAWSSDARVVIRDDALPDAKDLSARSSIICTETRKSPTDLNRPAEPHGTVTSLVQNAYTLLGGPDWRERRRIGRRRAPLAPVMLTVCNRTDTAVAWRTIFARVMRTGRNARQ